MKTSDLGDQGVDSHVCDHHKNNGHLRYLIETIPDVSRVISDPDTLRWRTTTIPLIWEKIPMFLSTIRMRVNKNIS